MATENVTMLESMIDPEVMAPMISAKLPKAIVATPFAKIDTTLQGKPGSTITIPRFKYIGDAEDLAEGIKADTAELTTDKEEYTVKKAVKQVRLTDEAVLSGYGNPVGEANNQLGMAIANKIDNDVIDTLLTAPVVVTAGAGDAISYDGIVDALDYFNEETNVEKVMFINPHQVSELRKDPDFISRDKYGNQVMVNGEIGMVANARIVPSRKVVAKNGVYTCPIVQLRPQEQTGDEASAVTIFLKRNVNVERQRELSNYTTLIGADEHYVVGLTDESKVVLAQFKATEAPSL
jgi:N4-gp56 family major capsid protein